MAAGKVTDPALVARIKGALAIGIPTKAVARLTGASIYRVRAYAQGKRAADIEADPAIAALFAAFMRGEA